jgi:uncharacterized membrane protein YfcA
VTLGHAILLFAAATAGGMLNAVAGGGAFLSFPALIFTGMPPINANATNTVITWPGSAAAMTAYRREMAGYGRMVLMVVLTGITGGLAGANLLLKTPQSTFMRMVPFLLLGATLLLAFGPQLSGWMGLHGMEEGNVSGKKLLIGAIAQLTIAVYIGYFGAGAGILTLALFSMLGLRNIHAMNGLKALLAAIGNAAAVVAFIIAGAVRWPQALLMVCGAVLGGYGGAWYAQRLNPKLVRYFAIAVGTCMTVYFFMRY